MQEYKRWYDHDPLLLEVVNLLKNYQEELKAETTLEVAYMLRKIAEHLENKALKRQNLNIQLNFEEKNEINT